MDFISDKVDFTVDASYEFSTFILKESKGFRLTHVPEFCTVSNENCATYPKPFFPCVICLNINTVKNHVSSN
jgi:hypothetical protein